MGVKQVNGKYVRTNQTEDGLPVFQKEGESPSLRHQLFRWQGSWRLAWLENKQYGWASSYEAMGKALPRGGNAAWATMKAGALPVPDHISCVQYESQFSEFEGLV